MNLNFGILGAAKIAPQGLIEPARELKGVTVWSVGARDKKRAQQFAEMHEVPVVHPDYEAVIHDSDIQAVYIPLPISEHAEWA
ncbi:MAG: Gfo/Idh/MocA family oxidoreductase, partial [Pseudomonadales bacterium]